MTKKQTRETMAWLTATTVGGRRIEILGWKRLAKLYYQAEPADAIRKIINAEARRCGYAPRIILALNA